MYLSNPAKFTITTVVMIVVMLTFTYVVKYGSYNGKYSGKYESIICDTNITYSYSGWACEDPDTRLYDGYVRVMCNGSIVITKKICSQSCPNMSPCDYPSKVIVYKFIDDYLLKNDYEKIKHYLSESSLFIGCIIVLVFSILILAVMCVCNSREQLQVHDIEMQNMN